MPFPHENGIERPANREDREGWMDDEVEVLQGGVGNAGAVVRIGDEVERPLGPHTNAIHALLRHVRDAAFDGVPEVLGVVEGRERLRFIPGEVPLPPFPAWSLTDEVLSSTVSLLRRFHDATAGFVPPRNETITPMWSNEMADPRPGAQPVICHNDVCPENVIHRGGVAVALLDFEFAAPGRREWDLAALARMCVPVDAPEDAARTGREDLDPFRRLAVVADAYGLDGDGRREMLEALEEQVAAGGAFVRRRVEAGEPAFVEMWHAMGGAERFERRRRWFRAERHRFEAALAA